MAIWKVIGGGKSGGIVVREGQKLATPETPEKLEQGALVEEIQLSGERLHFNLKSGKGPAAGWVSIKMKGNSLLIPYTGPSNGGPDDWGGELVEVFGFEEKQKYSWADAMCEYHPDFDPTYESPHSDDPQWKKDKKQAFRKEWTDFHDSLASELGTWKCYHEATSVAAADSLHILCLCLSESGHLMPILRIARACCDRDAVGRVTFVTNVFGCSKVANWLKDGPDPTGKLRLLGFQDGWNESLQTQCNWFAQEEDGSLMGISCLHIAKNAASCLQTILLGEHRVSGIITDMASEGGYNPVIETMKHHPKTSASLTNIPQMISAPCTILGCGMFGGRDTTVFLQCFNSPMFAPLLTLCSEAFAQKAPDEVMPSIAKSNDERQKEVMTEMMTKLAMGTLDPNETLPKNVVPVGIIVDQGKGGEISQDLEAFITRDDKPVIYVSMGSVANFNAEQLAKMCEGLTGNGEWRVIWSLRKTQQALLPEGGIKALGSDFYVSSWLPQAELLVHKKIALFISHCGWGATSEAIVSRKPVLAFPMFADQNANAMLMCILGMCKILGEERFPTLNAQTMMDPKISQLMARWMTISGQLRENLTPTLLKDDIRHMLTTKAYKGGANRACTMNTTFQGGAPKAAEHVERIALEAKKSP
mmetsp:Transcript_81494/g.174595  ORF Transcript_81494/g.174595 Transcript_81494/m.174595 type:complete len:646 (-) Transcript_81494:95-2032(-)